ncbi:putative lisH domain-containing protein FOPNL [Monocercomonoides exilis]|uniref:putative lisH domain-containing protein FOPNL n=1 Tax=Monocercomonoides exilis TaxID=2049356 RepID=UPI003559436D|nr:putative lisH domain-containing protein FOPNL [Monocercomonoides exilis]|eukprot:MONOS_3512.1-p1 / transcript=MONOS_3512.1 / gene=MONOS_3512 / organism=Monocercomonoides_exilis_PA203 / gene_product=unspecified product / transcript_product=unspecified product / location=Mono_scaffold00083:55614-56400(-) / protein_length=184 / sequence_SO=supercontig / SO=protein_coding / is_pseudo=false
MSTVEALKKALNGRLEENGALQKLRAQIRAEIFKVINDSEEKKPPTVTAEQFLMNELIRDYLKCSELDQTLQVFMPESEQPEGPIDRSFLRRELGLPDDSSDRPVLESLIALIRSLRIPLSSQPQPSAYQSSAYPSTAPVLPYQMQFPATPDVQSQPLQHLQTAPMLHYPSTDPRSQHIIQEAR